MGSVDLTAVVATSNMCLNPGESNMSSDGIDRRTFLERTVSAGAALTLAGIAKAAPAGATATAAATWSGKKIRVGVIGCGSVSNRYLPHLAECPYVELVSTCDIIPERAVDQAKNHNVPNNYPHISKMLAGAGFRSAREYHRHAGTRASQSRGDCRRQARVERKADCQLTRCRNGIVGASQETGNASVGAPVVVTSPQFAFMAKTLNSARSGAWRPPMPTTATPVRPGPPSSIKKAAAACRISAFTTSRA